jgi:hypothetical protein
MGLFGKSPQQVEEEKLDGVLRRVIITPETMEQYSARVGYAVKMVDTGCRDKGIFVEEVSGDLGATLGTKKRLVDGGVEAIVNAHYCNAAYCSTPGHYGLPVRRA